MHATKQRGYMMAAMTAAAAAKHDVDYMNWTSVIVIETNRIVSEQTAGDE